MHLKVCPNSACGKVSEVEAKICETCGQLFPPIALVVPGGPAEETQQDDGDSGLKKGAAKPRMAALPLVIVAIVAGGLPLLWLNRGHLPMPKTWQATASSSQVGGAANATVSPISVPANAPAGPAGTPANGPLSQLPSLGKTTDAAPSPDADKTVEAAEKPALKAETKPHAQRRASSSRKAAPPRPCTEAESALGICASGGATK